MVSALKQGWNIGKQVASFGIKAGTFGTKKVLIPGCKKAFSIYKNSNESTKNGVIASLVSIGSIASYNLLMNTQEHFSLDEKMLSVIVASSYATLTSFGLGKFIAGSKKTAAIAGVINGISIMLGIHLGVKLEQNHQNDTLLLAK
jgi:putative effector of murein hydrolase